MVDSMEIAATRMAVAGIDLGTNKTTPTIQAVPPSAVPASTKDTGRVRIGGASIRF